MGDYNFSTRNLRAQAILERVYRNSRENNTIDFESSIYRVVFRCVCRVVSVVWNSLRVHLCANPIDFHD